jgi:hypothetical protein
MNEQRNNVYAGLFVGYVRLAYTSVPIRPYDVIGVGCSCHFVTKNSVMRLKKKEEEDSVELPGLYVQEVVRCYSYNDPSSIQGANRLLMYSASTVVSLEFCSFWPIVD